MSEEYISRDDLLGKLCRRIMVPQTILEHVLADIPSADVAPIRRAHWIQEEYWSEGIGMGESYGHYYKCSACGKRVKLYDLYLDDYCRKCGAEMYEAKECERKRQEFDEMLAARNKKWRAE